LGTVLKYFRGASLLSGICPNKQSHRMHDAEVKLLEAMAARYSENPGIQGIINLFSERQPCESCANVIEQFKAMFPNLEMPVEWYQGGTEE
jgi:hypothetical protein